MCVCVSEREKDLERERVWCSSYLFYGSDSDNKEEGQTTGDWAGGGVNDKLQGRRGRKSMGGWAREEHESEWDGAVAKTVVQ